MYEYSPTPNRAPGLILGIIFFVSAVVLILPFQSDRLLASLMGEAAVDALLAGKSNLVVCKIKGDIVLTDIRYALILDRMYKGKLKGGDLDDFTPEQIKSMEAACAEKKRELAGMYHAQWRLSL